MKEKKYVPKLTLTSSAAARHTLTYLPTQHQPLQHLPHLQIVTQDSPEKVCHQINSNILTASAAAIAGFCNLGRHFFNLKKVGYIPKNMLYPVWVHLVCLLCSVTLLHEVVLCCVLLLLKTTLSKLLYRQLGFIASNIELYTAPLCYTQHEFSYTTMHLFLSSAAVKLTAA